LSTVTTPPLQFETARLLLAVPRPEDAARCLVYAHENRAHLAPWEPTRGAQYWTLDHWRRQLEAVRVEAREGGGYRTLVLDRGAPDGPVVGMANLSQIERSAFQCAQLGYSLAAARQGQGLMREALQGLLGFAFGELRLHRVQAAHRPENERSARVLDALGFEREGLAREYLFIDGAWRDHVLTAKRSPYPLSPPF